MDQSYQRPSGGKVSELQAEFIEWLLDPARQGSQNEWARSHSIHPTTCSVWKKRDGIFRNEWERRAAELNVSPDRIQDVIEAVFQSATDKSAKDHVKAAELYLRFVDRFTPATKVVTSEGTAKTAIEDMTDEELQEALQSEWRSRKAGASVESVPTDVLQRLDYFSAGGTG